MPLQLSWTLDEVSDGQELKCLVVPEAFPTRLCSSSRPSNGVLSWNSWGVYCFTSLEEHGAKLL